MGYRIALYPITALLAAARTLEDVYGKVVAGRGAHEVTAPDFSSRIQRAPIGLRDPAMLGDDPLG